MTATQPGVRFKRCPQCGAVVLMTAEICPTCDRHFQTTGDMKRQSASFSNPTWATANPYGFEQDTAYQPATVSNSFFEVEQGKVQYGPILLAAVGLGFFGMMLNHQFTKGLLVLGIYLLTIAAVATLHLAPAVSMITYLIVFVGGYTVSLIDVIGIAQKYARGETVREWEWF
jgi:hypothetical protein